MTNQQIIEWFSSRGLWDAAAHWLSLNNQERRRLINDLGRK